MLVEWTEEHQRVLSRLIDALITPPVLAYPDFNSPFTLHTDASEQGLGAVLYQKQDGKLRVIAYGSRTLTPAERNYRLHSGKLEFLALKWAVCENFRDYLFYAPHFTVYTDNNPLTYIMSTAKRNAVGYRWVGEPSDFRFNIKYRPGKVNVDADTLSRFPLNIDQYITECTEELSSETVKATWEGSRAAEQQDVAWLAVLNLAQEDLPECGFHAFLEEINPDELRKAQKNDSDISEIIKLKKSNAVLTSETRRGARGAVKKNLCMNGESCTWKEESYFVKLSEDVNSFCLTSINKLFSSNYMTTWAMLALKEFLALPETGSIGHL
ncbi:hypothetical protein QQF64_031778 [Cirrhinus molitorella]|uniref:Reverse transcriptase/retrotransposon-derived protein RNase H-like domain-containing protein n=1 Tax=Cirrhinus molitorella TaxID=172907 RepID=A0ABR3MXZ3_9TELE